MNLLCRRLKVSGKTVGPEKWYNDLYVYGGDPLIWGANNESPTIL